MSQSGQWQPAASGHWCKVEMSGGGVISTRSVHSSSATVLGPSRQSVSVGWVAMRQSRGLNVMQHDAWAAAEVIGEQCAASLGIHVTTGRHGLDHLDSLGLESEKRCTWLYMVLTQIQTQYQNQVSLS